MVTFRWILDSVREAALCSIGSPHSRTRQLAALRRLDAHLLADIGITPDEAERGAIWRAAPTEQAARPAVHLEIRRPYPNR